MTSKKPEIHEYVVERDVIVRSRYIVHASTPELAKQRITRMAHLELLPAVNSEVTIRKGHWRVLDHRKVADA